MILIRLVKVHTFVHEAASGFMAGVLRLSMEVIRVRIWMIESLVYGMLLEFDWLNIMLIVISMIKRVMCLVIGMVCDSLVP